METVQMFPRQTNSTFILVIVQKDDKMPFRLLKAVKNFQRKLTVQWVTKEAFSLLTRACNTFFKVLPFDLKSPPLCSGGAFLF